MRNVTRSLSPRLVRFVTVFWWLLWSGVLMVLSWCRWRAAEGFCEFFQQSCWELLCSQGFVFVVAEHIVYSLQKFGHPGDNFSCCESDILLTVRLPSQQLVAKMCDPVCWWPKYTNIAKMQIGQWLETNNLCNHYTLLHFTYLELFLSLSAYYPQSITPYF